MLTANAPTTQTLKSGFDPHLNRLKAAIRRRAAINRPRVRVGSKRESLYAYIRAHQEQFPTEYRLILAAQGHPLPAEPCGCAKCRGKMQGWPVGYQRGGVSWECWLHDQSMWFLHNLPSSSSIVRFG